MKKAFKNHSLKAFVLSVGRGERIRTFDPLVPNQMRYQAALRPDIGIVIAHVQGSRRKRFKALRLVDFLTWSITSSCRSQVKPAVIKQLCLHREHP